MASRKRNAASRGPDRDPRADHTPARPSAGGAKSTSRADSSQTHTRARSPRPQDRDSRRSAAGQGASVWIWGSHATLAALANPARSVSRLLLTDEARGRHDQELGNRVRAEMVGPAQIATLLPAGAVHQGLAALVKPLENPDLSESCEPTKGGRTVVLVLDQVTDPRNVGAILRSAAAFGVKAIVATAAHSPPESGTLAKAASGALERLPFVRVPNLVRALATLAELGYWSVGLDSAATETLDGARHQGAVALVLGAEGSGMRRLTSEHCDFRARLATHPVEGATGSLNVSVAASVALYELTRA